MECKGEASTLPALQCRPKFGPKIGKNSACVEIWLQQRTSSFQGAESLGQRNYSVFGQEGLRWRMRKDIEDLHLAKCSTLYSTVFNNVHNCISWSLNFVGSPGHEIYAPRKFDTRKFCPTKISTIMVHYQQEVAYCTT